MKKRTTENIQPEPKLNSEPQTILQLPAKLLPSLYVKIGSTQTAVIVLDIRAAMK
jgi:hypothetical protein